MLRGGGGGGLFGLIEPMCAWNDKTLLAPGKSAYEKQEWQIGVPASHQVTQSVTWLGVRTVQWYGCFCEAARLPSVGSIGFGVLAAQGSSERIPPITWPQLESCTAGPRAS